GCSLGIQTADPSSRGDRLMKDLELCLRHQVAKILNLQAVAQVRLVRAITQHHVGIFHARKGQGESNPDTRLKSERDQSFNNLQHSILLDKRHLQVELSEFRLAVCTQVFIAHTPRDLEVLVEAGDHEQLLVKLWRLRQGKPAAWKHPTRHQVVTRPLRCASTE